MTSPAAPASPQEEEAEAAAVSQQQQQPALRAYNDPVIFKDDRVLSTLLKKESKYLPGKLIIF